MTVRQEDIEVLKSIIREYFFLSQLTMTNAANVTMSRKKGQLLSESNWSIWDFENKLGKVEEQKCHYSLKLKHHGISME